MANALEITLHDLGAETTAGQSASVDISTLRSAVALTLRVGAVVGSLQVYVETSDDDSDWRSAGSFDALTGKGVWKRSFDRCGRYMRVRWTVGTSATFSVAGEAHTLFAEREDLTTALPPNQLTKAATGVIADALIKASTDVEDSLARTNPTPITKWTTSVTERTAEIAAFKILKQNGFAGGGVDEFVVKAYDDARAWLKAVRKDEFRPPGIAPASNVGPKTSSGNPDAPGTYKPRMSDNFGDF